MEASAASRVVEASRVCPGVLPRAAADVRCLRAVVLLCLPPPESVLSMREREKHRDKKAMLRTMEEDIEVIMPNKREAWGCLRDNKQNTLFLHTHSK